MHKLSSGKTRTIKRFLAVILTIALLLGTFTTLAIAENSGEETGDTSIVETVESSVDEGESSSEEDESSVEEDESSADEDKPSDGGEYEDNTDGAAISGTMGVKRDSAMLIEDWADFATYFDEPDSEYAFYELSANLDASADYADLFGDTQAVINWPVVIDGNNFSITALDEYTTPGVGTGLFVVKPNGNLILTNITLDGDEFCRLIDIKGGTVTLGDGAVLTGGVADLNGGAVQVSGGTFILNGGEITGNTTYSGGSGGGGVYVNGGTFEMQNGVIQGNGEPYSLWGCVKGGGVYIVNGDFIMSDGEISGNSASTGGGVYVGAGGTFTMTGGSIKENGSSDSISRSLAGGGVYLESGATFNMQGAPVIKDNIAHSEPSFVPYTSNVHLVNGQEIMLTGELTSGANIGVYTEEAIPTSEGELVKIADGAGSYTVKSSDSNFFYSDKPLVNASVQYVDVSGYLHYIAICYAEAAAADTMYVDFFGDDTYGDGSIDQPYATIYKAYEEVEDGGEIRVLSDLDESSLAFQTYGEDKSVTVIGYGAGTEETLIPTMRTITATGTSFSGAQMVIQGAAGGTSTVTLSHLTLDAGELGAAIWIRELGTLNIIGDTVIKNGKKNIYGAGIDITGNASGPAIVNITGGHVQIMNNETTTGANGGAGAGVAVGDYSTLNISGSNTVVDIKDNTAVVGSGGGVYIGGSSNPGNGACNISDATVNITGNETDGYGGGIRVAMNGKLHITGGEVNITQNTDNGSAVAGGATKGGGLSFSDTATVKLGGGAKINITGNTGGNVYLNNNRVLSLTSGSLHASSAIGVFCETMPTGPDGKVTIAQGVDGYNATEADKNFFSSDKPTEAGIIFDDDDKTVKLAYSAKAATPYDVNITLGGNMSLDTDSGAYTQNGVTGEITPIKIKADTGYELPASVTIGGSLTYTRHEGNTTATISGTPTAAVTVTLPAATPAYTVTITPGGNMGLDIPSGAFTQTVSATNPITAIKIKADTGYALPETVNFTGTGLTYTRDAGKTTATISGTPTSNVTATIDAAAPVYNVAITLGGNMTLDTPSGTLSQAVAMGSAIDNIKIKATAGYEMPASVTFTGTGLTYTRNTLGTATISGTPTSAVTATIDAAAQVNAVYVKQGVPLGGDGTYANPYNAISTAFANITNYTTREIRVLNDLSVANSIIFDNASPVSQGYRDAMGTAVITSYVDEITLKTDGNWKIQLTRTDTTTYQSPPFITISGGRIVLKNITLDANSKGAVVHVDGRYNSIGMSNTKSAELVMEDGSLITGGNQLSALNGTFNAGGVTIYGAYDTFTMNGGEISGNYGTLVSAVYVGAISLSQAANYHVGGTFNLFGGRITNNKSTGDNKDNYVSASAVMMFPPKSSIASSNRAINIKGNPYVMGNLGGYITTAPDYTTYHHDANIMLLADAIPSNLTIAGEVDDSARIGIYPYFFGTGSYAKVAVGSQANVGDKGEMFWKKVFRSDDPSKAGITLFGTTTEVWIGKGISTPSFVFNVNITPGANMSLAAGSGAWSQSGVDGPIVPINIVAKAGYELPEEWNIGGGLTYTRDETDPTKATITGSPNAAINATMPGAKIIANAVSISLGSNMSRDTSGGALSQNIVSGAITTIKIKANPGFELPANMALGNGLTYTIDPNDPTRATISGIPAADVSATISAATVATGIYVKAGGSATATGSFADPFPSLQAAYDALPTDANSREIRVMGDLTVTAQTNLSANKTVTITSYDYPANTPSATAHTITATGTVANMLNITAGTVTLKNIEFDAAQKGRVVNVGANATLSLENGSVITGGKLSSGGAGAGINVAGMLKMSGNPVVKDNFSGDEASNVYLATGKTITLTGALNNTKIGVSVQDMPNSDNRDRVIVQGSGYNVLDTDKGFFISDKETAGVIDYDSGNKTILLKFLPLGEHNVKTGIGGNGDGYITIDPTDSTKSYALFGPNGITLIDTEDGTGGKITFGNLQPGQEYTVVEYSGTQPDNAIATPNFAITVPAVDTGVGGNVTADIGNGAPGQTSITINPSSLLARYAVVDSNNNKVVPNTGTSSGWQSGTGGKITFTGLAPNTEYRIVTIPHIAPDPEADADFSGVGTPITTPNTNIDPKNIKRTGVAGGADTITLTGTDAAQEYAIFDDDGKQVGTWKSNGTGPVAFTNLDPTKPYWVITRPTDNGVPTAPVLVPPRSNTGSLGADNGTVVAEVKDNDPNPDTISIKIKPTDLNTQYAVIQKNNGTPVSSVDPSWTDGVWQDGVGGSAWLTFDDLEADEDYIIVTRPAGSDLTPQQAAVGSGLDIHTPDDGIKIPGDTTSALREGSTTAGKDKVTLSGTESGQDYVLVPLDAIGNPDWSKATGWQSSTGSDLVFDPIDQISKYRIFTRENNAPDPNSLPVAGNTVAPILRAEAGIDVSTGHGKITVDPTDANLKYVLLDSGDMIEEIKDTGIINGGSVDFFALIPGQTYTVIAVDKNASVPPAGDGSGIIHELSKTLTVPTVDAAVGGNATASSDASTATITINPASNKVQYALIDPANGNLLVGWKSKDAGGKVVFDNLVPAKKYEIVAWPETDITNAPSTLNDPTGLKGNGVAVTVPAANLKPIAPADVSNKQGTTPNTNKIVITNMGTNQDYGLYDPDTGVTVWNATGIFDDLESGKAYEVTTRSSVAATGGEASLHAMPLQISASVPANNIEGGVNADGTTAFITINPTDPTLDYALLDKNGNLVPGVSWQNKTDKSAITFSGLVSKEEYKIVTRPTGTAPANPTDVVGGTEVVTPPAAVTPAIRTEDTATTDKVTFPTVAGNDYAVVEKGTGTIAPNGDWIAGNGSNRTVTGLDPAKEYEVLVRKTDTGDGTLYLTSSTDVPKLPDDFEATAEWASESNTSVTISPTDPNYNYAMIDKDGNLAPDGWQNSPDTNGTLTWDNLPESTVYTVIYYPKNQSAPTDPTTLKTISGEKYITPIKATAPVIRDTVTPATNPATDKVTFPTETGKEYAVVEKGSTTPVAGGSWIGGIGNGAADSGIRIVAGLDPAKEYEVLVRVTTNDDDVTALTNSTAVPKLPDDFAATAEWNSANSTSITISPTDPNYNYAIVSATGALGGDGWINDTDVDGTLTWDNLPEGMAYTVVCFPKAQTPPTGTMLENMSGKKIATPFEPVNANKIKTSSETFTITETKPYQSYALIDPATGDIVTVSTGSNAGWINGKADNGGITFNNLTPGKVYEVITVPVVLPAGFTKDDASAKPGTKAATKFSKVTGEIESDATATVTVEPTRTDTKYAIVDKNGNIVAVDCDTNDGSADGWQTGTGDELDFTGLTPGEVYKVISVPINNPDSGYPADNQSATVGTAIIALKNPAPAINATSTSSTITVRSGGATATDPAMEYALLDPYGNIVNGEWKNSPKTTTSAGGGAITFAGLNPGIEYTVVARPVLVTAPNATFTNTTRPYVLPGFPIATGFANITGDYTSGSGDTSITINPTDSGMMYAVVKENGDVVDVTGDDWKNSSDGGALTFGPLDAGANYKVVSIPDDGSAAPASSDLQAKAGVNITSPIAPVDSANITAAQTSITVRQTDPTVEYAIYDPISGAIVAGGWKTGNNGDLVFSPVAAGQEYKVVTRKKTGDASVTSVYALPDTTVPTGAITVTYTVTFNQNGGNSASEPEQTPVPVNATFNLPPAPEKTGFVFMGWSDGNRTYPAESTYTMPARNVTLKAKWKEEITGISGTVYKSNGDVVDDPPGSGAAVSLWRGNTQIGSTVETNGSGVFTISLSTAIEAGTYTIITKYKDIVLTQPIKLPKNPISIDLPPGNTSTIVEVIGDTPPITVGKLQEQIPGKLTTEDEEVLAGNGVVELEFVAEQLNEEIVPQDDKTKIDNKKPNGMTLGMYLDFSLWKKVKEWDASAAGGTGGLSDETIVSNVSTTPTLLEIYIPLPAELQGMKEYRIVRVHNNVAQTITTSTNKNAERIELEKDEDDNKVVGLTLFAKNFSTYALAYSESALPNNNNNNSGNNSGSGSGSSGGGGSAAVSTHWIEMPEAKTLAKDAKDKGLDYASSSSAGITGIREKSLLELGESGLSYRHDTLEGGAVQVRVYIDEPANATKDIFVSGYVKGTAVDSVKAKFEKHYPDKKIAVISLDQQGDFGMTVRVAAKVNLDGMNAENLYFYAYDKKTNKYVNFKPEYRIDSNGYLHFATYQAGDIIISSGPLKGEDIGAAGQKQTTGGNSDYLDNPGTGGDGPGCFIDDARVQATAQLADITETQETDSDLIETQQTAQAMPDDSANQIKLNLPDALVVPAAPVTLGVPEDGENSNMLIIMAIAGVLLLICAWLIMIIPHRRRKRVRTTWFDK